MTKRVAICYNKALKENNMNDEKNGLDEKELEDTEVAEEVTPGGIEVPKEEGQKEAVEPEAKVTQEDPSAFSACITLEAELIETKSIQEITTVLDNQLSFIREKAIRAIARIKN